MQKKWIQIALFDSKNRQTQEADEPQILFVLQGEAELTLGHTVKAYRAEEFHMVNVLQRYELRMKQPGGVCRISLNTEKIRELVNLSQWEFQCDSSMRDAAEIRRILQKICSLYFKMEHTEVNSQDLPQAEEAYLQALFYELLHLLLQRHMRRREEADEASTDEVRLAYIRSSLKSSYAQEITLAELAEQLHCTPAYLSKYIKRKLGKNFRELLNEERVRHSAEDMLKTDKMLMRIAMEHGFPTTAAFQKAFKSYYHMLPSEYRKEKRQETGKEDSGSAPVSADIRQLLSDQSLAGEEEETPIRLLKADATQGHIFRIHWNRMINAGGAKDLLRADMQQHLTYLQQQLGFSYVRFWDIYDSELYLFGTNRENYNFSKLDSVIDFLLNHQMKPYMELGFKPQVLLRDIGDYLITELRQNIFDSCVEYGAFLDQMIRHFVSRYGLNEVESWYFELWKPPQDSMEEYLKWFETICRALRGVAPDCKIGGGGLNRNQGQTFRTIVAVWKESRFRPDFISLYSYPYQHERVSYEKGTEHTIKDTDAYSQRFSRDPDYLRNYLELAEEILEEYGMSEVKLHVTEWNFTVSNRSYINDSRFKGAYVIKNLMDSIGKCEILGYWLASDLFSEYFDTEKLLTGGVGLLTRNGICKPAFYGISFMNRLGSVMLGQSENMLVTTDGHDSYYIVCQNCQYPDYRYYISSQSTIGPQDVKSYFPGTKLQVSIRIRGVKNGTYILKRRAIREGCGSVLDEWQQMGYTDALSTRDIQYLKQICVPRITMETCVVQNHCLNLDYELEVNEIMHLHVIYDLSKS